jgi:hypothetical protein
MLKLSIWIRSGAGLSASLQSADRCIEFQMSEILWWLVGGADQPLGNF